MKAGQAYQHAGWIAYSDSHSKCFYSETGENYAEIENVDKGLFDISDSSLSTNSTRTNRGLVPGVLYTLA